MRPTLRLLAIVSWLTAAPLLAGIDARMLRFPDVSETRIAFVYAGDIWVVPKSGGVAQQLSTPAGHELFPRFSPDGSRIAFSGNYDGNLDLYVMPTGGGLPERLTHHPMPDIMLDWYPGGEALLYASPMAAGKDRFNHLYKTSPEGGLPERLPLPYGEDGAIAADGKTLAYLPHSRDFRTWKRYRGGLASRIWLFDLEDHGWSDLSTTGANDSRPMWHGETLYFLSDRGANRRANIWAFSRTTEQARQVTHLTTYDVRFPSIGPSEIVFEVAGRLHLLDLESETTREVDIEVLTDRSARKPQVKKVAELVRNAGISPSGKRAVVEARGEIFTVPAEHGVVRNLTRTSGAAERFPAWSPDGEKIAYWSDAGGEYQLTLRNAGGTGEEQVLTAFAADFRYQPYWSPDSRKLAFADQTMRIRIYDLETERLAEVDKGLYMFHGTLASFRVSWSPDSRWLAYHRTEENLVSKVFLYDTESSTLHRLTSGYYNASFPTFDPDGKYLYLLWDRSFQPAYSSLQSSWIYANTTQVAAVPLRLDVPSPLAPRNDEEGEDEDEGDEGDDDDEGDEDDEDDEVEPVEIDLAGFESRIVILPAAAGNYLNLAAVSGKVLYLRLPRTGSTDRPFGGQTGDVVFFDLEEREEKTVAESVGGFEVAANGEKILVVQDSDFAILDLEPDQEIEKKLALDELEMTVDPAAEWRQLFREAWRLERDYFYDPGMHGVDWEEIGRRYGELLDDAVTRWDVNFLIGELIGELNASHAYRGGGDAESSEQRGVGLLGADFALDSGAYRIADIIDLAPWETEVRSPLREPGVEVEEGDYLLAVNGVPVDPAKDPWAAFQGLAEKTVMLTVGSEPTLEGARQVLVKTLASEARLRNLAWIEAKRKRVEEATDGRVGYVYVPSTGLGGQTELVRQFAPEIRRQGLIVDERFNNGGQIPDRFIELLNRPLYNYWAVRDGTDWQWPMFAHTGPKAMLINGWSGSGGDLFPLYFKSAGLGPLIGRRTWGGLIGVSGAPRLIDGGVVTVPTFGIFSLENQWIVEGHGVEPDIDVVDDPAAMARGEDPQLERAIEEVLRLLETAPPPKPQKPPYPDRSGV